MGVSLEEGNRCAELEPLASCGIDRAVFPMRVPPSRREGPGLLPVEAPDAPARLPMRRTAWGGSSGK